MAKVTIAAVLGAPGCGSVTSPRLRDSAETSSDAAQDRDAEADAGAGNEKDLRAAGDTVVAGGMGSGGATGGLDAGRTGGTGAVDAGPTGGNGGRDAGEADACGGAGGGGIRCGSCGPVCGGTTPFCELADPSAPVCTASPAVELSGLRWEVPCRPTDPAATGVCPDLPAAATTCPQTPTPGYYPVNRRVSFGGRAGMLYDVTVRFRGVVEPKVYTGGQATPDRFRIGGIPTATAFNTYTLSFTGPTRPDLNQVYYLNDAGTTGELAIVYPIDYTKTLRVEGGSMVNLTSYDSDCRMYKNCMDHAAASCSPYQVLGSAFNGQFAQMDVISLTPVPPAAPVSTAHLP